MAFLICWSFNYFYLLLAFDQSGNLKVHESTHTGEKPFASSLCNKAFINTGSLNLKTYPCKECEKMFGLSFFMKNPKCLKTTSLQRMWQQIWVIFFHEKNPHWWEPPSLQRVWQEVWANFLLIKLKFWWKSISLQPWLKIYKNRDNLNPETVPESFPQNSLVNED